MTETWHDAPDGSRVLVTQTPDGWSVGVHRDGRHEWTLYGERPEGLIELLEVLLHGGPETPLQMLRPTPDDVRLVRPILGAAARNAAARAGMEDEYDDAIESRYGEGW